MAIMQRTSAGPISLPTAEAFAAMPRVEGQRYVESIQDAALRDEAARRFSAAEELRAQAYMSMASPSLVPMTAQGGTSQTSAAFAAGQTLNFNIPPMTDALAQAILIQVDLSFTYTAAGGSPYANWTPAAPHNFLEEVTLEYGAGGVQHRAHPWFYHVMDSISRGAGKTDGTRLFTPASGPINTDTQIDASLYTMPSISAGANTVRFIFRMDFSPMHDQAVNGLLSIAGGNGGTLRIRTATTVGADPLLNPIATNGTITALTGTIQPFIEIRTGRTLATWRYLEAPNLAGVPTFQTRQDSDLRILAANAPYTQRLGAYGRHYYMFSLIMDGTSSTVFSTTNNINGMALLADEAAIQRIKAYGKGTQTPMWYFWYNRRRTFQQQWPKGLIPWVIAPSELEADPDDRLGTAVLNMAGEGGWSNIYQQYDLAAIGGLYQPRVVTFYGSVTEPLDIVG